MMLSANGGRTPDPVLRTQYPCSIPPTGAPTAARRTIMIKPAPNLFSAPRRFDLFTVLVAAAAYAVLFTVMRLLDFPTGVMGFVGGLFAVVAAEQALGEGRISPRHASVFAAMLFWIAVRVGGVAVEWYSGVGRGEPAAPRIVIAVLGGILSGLLTGYIVGVLVAGVFLASFYLREGFVSRQSRVDDAHHDQDASPWDESMEITPANRSIGVPAENPHSRRSP